jgi:Rrf2 family protein
VSLTLGTRARYSLRLMIEVARFSDGELLVQLHDVALWTGISRLYLEQLAGPLVKARLLVGRPGRKGGYTLAGDPKDVRLLDIVEAASGKIALAECVAHPEHCDRAAFCQCLALWTMVSGRIRDVLAEFTLADMIDPCWAAGVREQMRNTGVRQEKESNERAKDWQKCDSPRARGHRRPGSGGVRPRRAA